MCLNSTPCDRGKHWDGCRRQNIGGWKKATLSLRIIYGTQFTLHHFHLFLSWMKNTFAVGWRQSLRRGFVIIDAHFIPRDRRERERRDLAPLAVSGSAMRLHAVFAKRTDLLLDAGWPLLFICFSIQWCLFSTRVVAQTVFQGIFTHFIYFKSTLYCVASHLWCSVF